MTPVLVLALALAAPQTSFAPTAEITSGATSDTIRYAPYTAVFSGWDSEPGPMGSPVVRYEWDFDDGSTGDGEIVEHEFSPGTWEITLTVTDQAGLQDTDTHELSVPYWTEGTSGTTYYCSSSTGSDDPSNDGSQSEPWASIEHAWANMGGSTDAPNRLMLMRGDTWSISSTLTLDGNRPAIFSAYGTGARPVLDFGSSSKLNVYGLLGEEKEFRGIEFKATPSQPGAYWNIEDGESGDNLAGAPVFRDCVLRRTYWAVNSRCHGLTFRDCEAYGLPSDDESFIWTGSDCQWPAIVGCYLEKHGNGNVNEGRHNLYLSKASNGILKQTESADSGVLGFKVRACHRVTVTQCVAYGAMDGIAVHGEGQEPWTFCSDVVVERCEFYDNANRGIQVGEVANVVIRNNWIHDNYRAGSWNGISVSPGYNDYEPDFSAYVVNNVIEDCKGTPVVIDIPAGEPYKLEILNNVILHGDGELYWNIMLELYEAMSLSGLVMDGNCWFHTNTSSYGPTTGNVVAYGAQTGSPAFYTWQEWRDLGFDFEASGIYGDPGLVSDTDPHLDDGSDCIDAGVTVPLALIELDWDGEELPVGSPDIGLDGRD